MHLLKKYLLKKKKPTCILSQLPDKSIASLVKYYYSWKKTRARTSLMDAVGENRNANTSTGGKRESGGSEPGGSDKDSDNDEKVSIQNDFPFIYLHSPIL